MRLQIQNINKIKEADIALNGLTVIVGENDMGKVPLVEHSFLLSRRSLI